MYQTLAARKDRNGFTLVELAVVIVLVGVAAAFGVPRFVKSVEKTRAAEAFSYLAAVRAAQEAYHAREGAYAGAVRSVDVRVARPGAFSVPERFAPGHSPAGLREGWSLTLTRAGSPAEYGSYTVTFTRDGYDPASSTVDGLADINPAVVPGRPR